MSPTVGNDAGIRVNFETDKCKVQGVYFESIKPLLSFDYDIQQTEDGVAKLVRTNIRYGQEYHPERVGYLTQAYRSLETGVPARMEAARKLLTAMRSKVALVAATYGWETVNDKKNGRYTFMPEDAICSSPTEIISNAVITLSGAMFKIEHSSFAVDQDSIKHVTQAVKLLRVLGVSEAEIAKYPVAVGVKAMYPMCCGDTLTDVKGITRRHQNELFIQNRHVVNGMTLFTKAGKPAKIWSPEGNGTYCFDGEDVWREKQKTLRAMKRQLKAHTKG